jgi:hypothetical protein
MVSGQQNHFSPMTDLLPLPPKPTTLELDILGHLKAAGGRCPALTALPIDIKSSILQRSRACERLKDRGWLDYDLDMTQFGLTLAGKTLLRLDTSVWPVTPDERLILRSCLGGRIGPGQINPRVPGGDRQRLLQGLTAAGLIVVYGEAIVHLRLTPLGASFTTAHGPPPEIINSIPAQIQTLAPETPPTSNLGME